MPGDVHVPGVGKIPKWGIYGAVGIGVIFIGYRWYSSKQAAATSTTAGTATTDPTIDPSTGVPYSEEYGYGSDYGTAGFGAAGAYPGSLAYYDPTTGQYIGTGVGITTVTQVTSNPAWLQASEAYLNTLGFNPTDVAAALGKYLVGAVVTADQATIIQAAIGAEGYPPQAGPVSGFPPGINTAPAGGQNPPPSSGGTVQKFPPPTGARLAFVSTNSARFDWNNTPSGTTYPPSYTVRVYQNGRSVFSTTVAAPSGAGGLNATATNLQPGTKYVASIWANGGQQSPSGATISFATHK